MKESSETSKNLPEWLSQKRTEILTRYGGAEQFAIAFNPGIQYSCAANIERSLMSDVPTIRQLLATYNENGVRVWLMAQMHNLNEATGVKTKMELNQMRMLSDVFLTKCPFLKASEVLIFFFKVRSGDFGPFYGSADAMLIGTFLDEFMKWRSSQLDKFYQKEREERRLEVIEQGKRTGITRARYYRRKFHRLGLKHNFKKRQRNEANKR